VRGDAAEAKRRWAVSRPLQAIDRVINAMLVLLACFVM